MHMDVGAHPPHVVKESHLLLCQMHQSLLQKVGQNWGEVIPVRERIWIIVL